LIRLEVHPRRVVAVGSERRSLTLRLPGGGEPDGGRADGAKGIRAGHGRAQLYVDSQLIAQDDFPVTTPAVLNPGGLTCGANPVSPITTDYQAPFRFTGTLHTVTVDLITDTDSEMRMAMTRQ
jgi:hypothetical protein